MKRVISTFLLAATLLAMLAGCKSAPAATAELQKAADNMSAAMISDYGVSGVQYALIDGGVIVLSGNGGVYAKDSSTALTRDTMFGIASLSKMYAAAAVMMLADEGKVDIDAPVTDYIPEFEMADKRYKEITPRMLMNHSSGLYGSHYHNMTTFGAADSSVKDGLLEELKTEKLKADPGAYSVYCNDGFELLEILTERVSGMSFTEFLAEKICKPLGLKNTKTPADDYDKSRVARAYDPEKGLEYPDVNNNLIATGGIYSTAEDICKFSELLMGSRETMLSKEAAARMQNAEYRKGVWAETDRNIFGYGLGYDAVDLAPFCDYGINAVAKGGDATYHSTLIALPEYDMAMAVVSSGGSSLYTQAFATAILLDYLKDRGIIDEIKPDTAPSAPVATEIPEELWKYQGLYGEGSAIQRCYDITFEKDSFTIPEGFGGLIPETKYIYSGNHEFKTEDGANTLTFCEADNGKTYIQLAEIMQFPGLGQMEFTEYSAVMLPRNDVSPDVMKAWEDRDGKLYMAVLEKPSSDMFITPVFMLSRLTVDSKNGYAQGCRIVDEMSAVTNIQIPIMNGRDLTDLTFSKQDGAEYMDTIDMRYICEDSVLPLASESASTVSIGGGVNDRWFKLGADTAGKTIGVSCPEGDAFAVYDKDLNLVSYSRLSGSRTCSLPEGGYIVFAGYPGDSFDISIK